MPNTYTQVQIHAVFAVRGRLKLIDPSWRVELEQYITGIVSNNGHKLLCIYAMPDHLHILIGMRPNQSLSSLIQDIKGCSSKWINQKGFIRRKFVWQEGFAAFACSLSITHKVVKYILNQETHHQKKEFSHEYRTMLMMSDAPDDRRLFFD